jgi:hypothetical protein
MYILDSFTETDEIYPGVGIVLVYKTRTKKVKVKDSRCRNQRSTAHSGIQRVSRAGFKCLLTAPLRTPQLKRIFIF